MKSTFSLVLGTIVLFLATTAQDSPITQTFLASVGLALYAVALSPTSSPLARQSLHQQPGQTALLGDEPDQEGQPVK